LERDRGKDNTSNRNAHTLCIVHEVPLVLDLFTHKLLGQNPQTFVLIPWPTSTPPWQMATVPSAA
jgi:hypothetical protein